MLVSQCCQVVGAARKVRIRVLVVETQTPTPTADEKLDFKAILPLLVIIPLLPIYAATFGANELMIGVLAAVYPLMQFMAGPFSFASIGHVLAPLDMEQSSSGQDQPHHLSLAGCCSCCT